MNKVKRIISWYVLIPIFLSFVLAIFMLGSGTYKIKIFWPKDNKVILRQNVPVKAFRVNNKEKFKNNIFGKTIFVSHTANLVMFYSTTLRYDKENYAYLVWQVHQIKYRLQRIIEVQIKNKYIVISYDQKSNMAWLLLAVIWLLYIFFRIET